MENFVQDQKLPIFDTEDDSSTEQTTITKKSVVEVFDFWVKTLRDSSKGPSPVLTPKRDLKIRQALKLYGRETCFQAIEGCKLSDFHMGKNQQGRRYDDIELILRDAKHIEQFVQYYLDANTGGGFLDEE